MPSDSELFLQEYEKTTEAYRHLRARHLDAPLFLNRNLFYMRHRSTRTNTARSLFKIESMLENAENKRKIRLGDNFTLMFLGYYDTTITDIYYVDVETFLSNSSYKKNRKKKQHTPTEQVGRSIVEVNPDVDALCPRKLPAVSIPTDKFQLVDGSKGEFDKLIIRVRVISNIMSMDYFNIDNGPSAKRRRTTDNMVYECDLVIFDPYTRVLLLDGDYKIPLSNSSNSMSFSKKKTQKNKLAEIISPPVLKFRIAWTKIRYQEYVDWPLPIITKREDQILMETDQYESESDDDNPNAVSGVDYHFFYNNDAGLKSQECNYITCPWCKLNCTFLKSLMMHFELCHARFSFAHVKSNEAMSTIEVRINADYDGTYTGSPHDFKNTSNFKRRLVNIWRPRLNKPILSENSSKAYSTNSSRR